MNIKAWFKSKTADRVLSPVREAIIELIRPQDSVLEVGCGTGNLLFNASGKISKGLGVDLDQSMIDFANIKKAKENVANLVFINKDITTTEDLIKKGFDVATSTLCLHEMDEKTAVDTLNLMAKYSSKIIIADYATPKTLGSKLSIEIDEFVSGHYGRFRAYRKNGEITYLAKVTEVEIEDVTKSPFDGINIWTLKGENCV